MDLEAIGYQAARGQPVELDDVRIPSSRVEDTMAEYADALIHMFDAATCHDASVDCDEAAKRLVRSAHAVIACCLVTTEDADMRDETVRVAGDMRDSLRVLDPRHWRCVELKSALHRAGTLEFRGRWAPLVDVC